MIRARLAQVQLALMLLTRLPAGRLSDPAPAMAAAAWAFPLAGLTVGAGGALVLWAAFALGLPVGLAAGLAIGAMVVLSGALHEDGLADFADGVWGGQTQAQRLEIMRDSRIGSYGVLALILSVGLRWQVLAWLAAQDLAFALMALVLLAMTSRVAPVVLMATLPPARAEGLGHMAGGVAPGAVLMALALAVLPFAFVMALPPLGVMLAIQGLFLLGLARLARQRLGGQTGDVLGAGQQVTELVGFLALCAALAV
ncbi:MAG: adenosylcobinamide-GDP ribazoletransferase [Rhodobacteraceae bacterium]|nr:adenosylcobinamide-GDP ribazoletransferase [Paracoccaceae bacterium]